MLVSSDLEGSPLDHVLTYAKTSLLGDYLRAGIGLAFAGGILSYRADVTWVLIIFGSLAVLFAYFTLRTIERHLTRVQISSQGIKVRAFGEKSLSFGDMTVLKLRFYGSRRDHKKLASGQTIGSGHLELTLAGAGRRLRLESSLLGFSYVAWQAAKAAREKALSLDAATAGNLLALGVDADKDTPAPAIELPAKRNAAS